jgi:hypothetical protein
MKYIRSSHRIFCSKNYFSKKKNNNNNNKKNKNNYSYQFSIIKEFSQNHTNIWLRSEGVTRERNVYEK